jgi:hypothetical protein
VCEYALQESRLIPDMSDLILEGIGSNFGLDTGYANCPSSSQTNAASLSQNKL